MLSLTAALFVMMASVTATRYYLVKTRVAEKAIDGVIERKLATSPLQAELYQVANLHPSGPTGHLVKGYGINL